MIPLLYISVVFLQSICVNGVTDAPRHTLFSTSEKDILDFDVPLSLIGAEKLALQSTRNRQVASQEISRSVEYSLPFDSHHFNFSDDDWSVYDLPNSEYEQMIVSTSFDITKELKISTTIKALSNVIIRYQVHLTSENTPVKPILSIFLISNGTKTHVKDENPSDLWSNSSISVNTGPPSKLLFVGVIRAPGNQIALRSFTFEILSQAAFERYGVPAHKSEGGIPIPYEAGVPTSHITPGPEYDLFTGSDIQDVLGQNISSEISPVNNGIHYLTDTNGAIIHKNTSFYNESSIESSNTLVNFSSSSKFPTGNYNYSDSQGSAMSVTPPASETMAASTHLELIPTYAPPTTPMTGQNSSSFESAEDSSGARIVFNLFAGLIGLALILIAFLWWRQRRNRADDEIPVFSRSATEHGNPTFLDDETNLDTGLSSDTPTNYRSFQ